MPRIQGSHSASPGDVRKFAGENDRDPIRDKTVLQWPVHPLLWAIFPIISLYVGNFGEVPLRDIWLPLSVALGITCLCMAVFRLLCNTWQRSAMVTSFAVLMFAFFLQIYLALCAILSSLHLPVLNYAAFFILWSLATLGGICALLRFPRDTRRLTRILNCVSLAALGVVVGYAIVLLAPQLNRRWQAEAATVDNPLSLTIDDGSPDIYYLVFDRYAGLETLRHEFDHDNRDFYEDLRQRGFFCAQNARANYPRTKISMASALNMRLLVDPIYENHVQLIDNHRVGRALRQAGYKYYHFGNWYGPVRRNANATYNWPASPYPSYFFQAFCNGTPVLPATQFASGWQISRVPGLSRPSRIEDKFAQIRKMTKEAGRKFVYAHFLLPHSPFMFNRDGTHTTRADLAGRTYEQSYIEQLVYTNRKTVELVDAIIANSATPPVIVLQADEGPALVPHDKEKSRIEKIRKRTGIITAFLLPDRNAEKLIPHNITPVNTFRVIFTQYFGASLPAVPDRVFYWDHATASGMPDESQIVRVVDVTAALSDIATCGSENSSTKVGLSLLDGGPLNRTGHSRHSTLNP